MELTRLFLAPAIAAATLLASVGCRGPSSPDPAPVTTPAEHGELEAAPAVKAAPAPVEKAIEPECTLQTPLKPGVPGSPGHLIPSDINPNGMSELAALMRTMQAELGDRRKALIAGAVPEPLSSAHTRIRCVWPTTPGDRNPSFDAMAQAFLTQVEAYNSAPDRGRDAFHGVIDGCVVCHEQTCAGPLAAIEPLRLPTP